MKTELTVEEARAAYSATLQTWLEAFRLHKACKLSQAELDAADQAVELATSHYAAALDQQAKRDALDLCRRVA